MASDQFEAFIDDQIEGAPENADPETYSEYLYGNPQPGLYIGVGLLVEGSIAEARRWFSPTAKGLTSRILDDPGPDMTDYIQKWDMTHIYDLNSRVNSWYWALQAAMLSADADCQETIGRAVYEALTCDGVEALDEREKRPRTDLDIAIAGTLCHEPIDEYLEIVRENVEHTGRPSTRRPHLVPQTHILEGIRDGDGPAIEQGLIALDDYHREYRAESRETHNVVERELNLEGMAYVAFARQRGVEVTYRSEYVPAVVSDDAAYPVAD